mgnify:CR=1 FL=1
MSTEQIRETVPTLAGIESIDDPAGEIRVSLGDGDNIVGVAVTDGRGDRRPVVVYLDYHQVQRLMVVLGAAAHRM